MSDMNKYSPIVSEFESEEQERSYVEWLEAKVTAARADPRPRIPHDHVMAEMRQIIAENAAKKC